MNRSDGNVNRVNTVLCELDTGQMSVPCANKFLKHFQEDCLVILEFGR